MSNDWFYSEKVKDHFFNPRNICKCEDHLKEFKADGVGEVGSPVCGDVMKMWIKVKDNKIVDCKWKTFGCASAIASTSMLSVMAIGKTLEEAELFTYDSELLYGRIVCLFILGRRQEGRYRLGEALIEDFNAHKIIFELYPDLEYDSEILSLISNFTT